VPPARVPDDFEALVTFAAGAGGRRPVLIGVSEGAGLAVLAATSDQVKHAVSGIVALGLPDTNELGWRWRDDVIYVTHGVPREPLFQVSAIAAQVAPVPLAAIHSTHDEFVPVSDVQRVLGLAGDPKRLWLIPAADHRFSDRLDELDRRVLDAMSWIDSVS
jgi:dienelactone hydrolase